MASQTVTTPIKGPQTLGQDSPGTWQHPRMEEISRRKYASTFDEGKLRVALISIILLLVSFLLPGIWPISLLQRLSGTYGLVFKWSLRIFRLVVTFNGYKAVKPIWAQKDDMSDIPLTPNQRALLGLGPASAPTTPGGTYITPPRYNRSISGSRASSRVATAGSSPFDRSEGSPIAGSPLRGAGGSFSGTSSAGGSPLVRKAVNKRASLGSNELLGMSSGADAFPPTPTPPGSGQRPVSVALNNKWLYKRRNGSPAGLSNYI